ncbi:MAG: 2-hydroxyacyl-CoA dehydratase, partial [Candidatus Helarchaeota archaeon]
RSLRYITGEEFYLKLIYEFIHAIFWNYDRYIKIGEEDGMFPIDSCFGTRMLYGNIIDNAKDIDFSLGLGTRCNWFSKYFEIVKDYKSPDNKRIPLIMLEIPNINDENGYKTLKENINQVIDQMEKITGKSITNNDLYKIAVLSNSIKKAYKKLMLMWSQDTIKIPPLAYTNLFALIHIAQVFL